MGKDSGNGQPHVTFDSIITCSKEMESCMERSRAAAGADIAILLLGESGTGKEMLARAIHAASRRREKPFVAVNCSALTETLLEAELFGYERGAALVESDHQGKFDQANGGTLFLDEVTDMSPTGQAKLLRALEFREYERVGGDKILTTDVRVVAATKRNPLSLVRAGRFREDLYYRLNEVAVEVPPLRRRKEDVPLLVDRFVRECSAEFRKEVKGVSRVVMSYLLKHDWPGNVRELRSVVKRGSAVAHHDEIWLEDLSLVVQVVDPEDRRSEEDEDLSLDAIERKHIERVLEMTKGNKKQACEILGISRPTLDRKIKAMDGRIVRSQ